MRTEKERMPLSSIENVLSSRPRRAAAKLASYNQNDDKEASSEDDSVKSSSSLLSMKKPDPIYDLFENDRPSTAKAAMQVRKTTLVSHQSSQAAAAAADDDDDDEQREHYERFMRRKHEMESDPSMKVVSGSYVRASSILIAKRIIRTHDVVDARTVRAKKRVHVEGEDEDFLGTQGLVGSVTELRNDDTLSHSVEQSSRKRSRPLREAVKKICKENQNVYECENDAADELDQNDTDVKANRKSKRSSKSSANTSEKKRRPAAASAFSKRQLREQRLRELEEAELKRLAEEQAEIRDYKLIVEICEHD